MRTNALPNAAVSGVGIGADLGLEHEPLSTHYAYPTFCLLALSSHEVMLQIGNGRCT